MMMMMMMRGNNQMNAQSEGGNNGVRDDGMVLKRGSWTTAEDALLTEYVRANGVGNWNSVQKNTGLARCGKNCRLRWANHLRPNLKKGHFSLQEERMIIELHAKMGNIFLQIQPRLHHLLIALPVRHHHHLSPPFHPPKSNRLSQLFLSSIMISSMTTSGSSTMKATATTTASCCRFYLENYLNRVTLDVASSSSNNLYQPYLDSVLFYLFKTDQESSDGLLEDMLQDAQALAAETNGGGGNKEMSKEMNITATQHDQEEEDYSKLINDDGPTSMGMEINEWCNNSGESSDLQPSAITDNENQLALASVRSSDNFPGIF
ncbi:Transcription factor WER [Hibiscus syriacus]|uniref:Transcription factor WER n=1 Tax=Hibiscus syriacus TaxID=106335 RepID=A0A6A3CDN0_HIBSY|nr:transcription factor MYB97-like [Hibiscus syriacus]KAE8725538.1 Transcription factor WER [Hibiscus syriacus]